MPRRADTLTMSTKVKQIRRRDWTGDAIVTVVAGALLASSVALPWANVGERGLVLSLHRPGSVSGVMGTEFGPPVLIAGLSVVAIGLAMLALGPRLWVAVLAVAPAFLGPYAVSVALEANRAIWQPLQPGLGLALALAVGLILFFVGTASAAVGGILWARGRSQARQGAPPGPGA
jgi:hypothetical protein